MSKNKTRITDTVAVKQFQQFSVMSAICSLTGLVFFWGLGLIALACAVRALSLGKHEANKTLEQRSRYLALAWAGALVGLANLILFTLSR